MLGGGRGLDGRYINYEYKKFDYKEKVKKNNSHI